MQLDRNSHSSLSSIYFTMFKKSDPVSSISKARTNNPFTPMRRFFKLELLKPIVALGKRARDQSRVADMPEKRSLQAIDCPASLVGTTAPKNTSFVEDRTQQQTRQSIARIALQQHDQPLDAIVITTLPSYPFCCHEDLLMMSRSQLVEAAVLLNSRLPGRSQIELADCVPDVHIRHSIEKLVGIVPEMPGAPKPIKSRRFERKDTIEKDLFGDLEQDNLPSPPTSPLSMRVSRRQERALPVMSSPPQLLERLEEEDENIFFTTNRPLKKKRKMSRSTISILDEDIDMEDCTPTRTQDEWHSRRRIHASEQPSSPSPVSSLNGFNVDSAFINMKSRHRSMGKNPARKRGGRKVASSSSQTGSSRKPANKTKRDYLEKQAITLNNYRPFRFSTTDSVRYHTRTRLLSSTSTNSWDEKVATIAEDESDSNTGFRNHNSGISPVENEDNQVAGGIENLRV